MTPSQLADKLDRIRNAIPRNMAVAQARVGAASVKIAQKWSSGGRTQAELDAADNPYAKRHGSGPYDPATVNKQKGTFFAGWLYDPSRKALVNAVPYGGALQHGTTKMQARDILGAIKQDLKPIMRQEARNAIKRSLKA